MKVIKVIKKILPAMFFAVTALSTAGVFAATLSQDTTFDVSYSTKSGRMTASVGLVNNESTDRCATILVGMYDSDHVLRNASIKRCTVPAQTNTIVTSAAVTVAEGMNPQTFVWNEAMQPLESGTTFRTRRKEMKISYLKINGKPALADSSAKIIWVDTATDLENVTVTDLQASCAAYRYDAANKSLIFTADDGSSTQTYTLKPTELQFLDFEKETIGEKPDGWTVSGNADTSVTVETDKDDASNQVLCLADNSTESGKIGAVYNLEALSPPYSITYKIMYERQAYEKGVHDVSTDWFHLRDASNLTIMSASVSDLGDGSLKFYTKSANGEKTVDAYLNLGAWHEIKLSCMAENEVRFYLDGVCIYTASPLNYASLARLSIFSTDSRMGTMYLDDIAVYANDALDGVHAVYAEIDAMFEGVLPWLTELYDPATGGFYTTISGMQNEGYVPSLESTAFVYAMLNSSETGALSTMPDAFKDKLIAYFQNAQSDADGFFYDYGVDPSVYTDRNKMRVYQQCVNKLNALGAAPLYLLPSERSTQAYSLLTLAATSSENDLPNGFPSYLKSVDSFIAKVASRDWDNNSWTAGDLTYEDTSYLIQLDQSVYQPYIDALFDWLAQRQDKDTGYWAKAGDTCFNALSGAFKVVRIYDRFNTAPPNIDKITKSITGTLFSGEEPSTACDLRNTLDMLSILKGYDADAVQSCLKAQERPVLHAYAEYMKLFFKEDGGASMYPTKSTSSFGGIPAGKQLAEGDIDGTQQMFLARYYLNKLFGRSVDNSVFAKQYRDFWNTLCKK
ncbi:MAG: hypothetical protein U0L92_07525 [Clostridia bacterium]|nr:hypothetical protein [Clostridia bacterium]